MSSSEPLEGVLVTSLRKIPDERGTILHMLRADDPHFTRFGEVYFSTAYPGIVKGWHEHTRQIQNYAVVSGMIKLVLFDPRESSTSFGKVIELFVGDENYCLVTIPHGVVNGYKCIGSERAIVANCSNLPHEAGEMIRHDPFGDAVPYNWEVVMS